MEISRKFRNWERFDEALLLQSGIDHGNLVLTLRRIRVTESKSNRIEPTLQGVIWNQELKVRYIHSSLIS